ncbi:hypothetical protein [Clostridium thermopalmarium]|jgi:hypothetical protein|uniref:hypothetical protein n=1 Tax=Clostridium thermopalmarium TaxID=29373 RepID=UPI001057BB81|nr:hypothetical protein [Clostridium thermopalmarium]
MKDSYTKCTHTLLKIFSRSTIDDALKSFAVNGYKKTSIGGIASDVRSSKAIKKHLLIPVFL